MSGGTYSLKDVRHLVENEPFIKKDIKNNLPTVLDALTDGFHVRDVLPIYLYLIEYGELRDIEKYILPMVYKLYNSQLRKGTPLNIYYGGYSPKTDYTYIHDQTYIEDNMGGFPTYVTRDKAYIYGIKPDIDSTAISLIVLADVVKRYPKMVKREVISAIPLGLGYLYSRDINRDGLLEQSENEDWAVGAHREWIVTYSNILYLIAMEKALDLFLTIGDKENIDDVQEKMPKVIDGILNRLWMNDYIINGIDKYGKYDPTYSLDTSLIALSETVNKDNKVSQHLKTLHRRLYLNNFLLTFYPPNYNEYVKEIREYTYLNGGAWIRYNILYAYGLAKIGYINEAATITKNLLEYRWYRWINPLNIKENEKGDLLTNSCLIQLVIKEIKKRLEIGPASTG
jgi:hypothetical protein